MYWEPISAGSYSCSVGAVTLPVGVLGVGVGEATLGLWRTGALLADEFGAESLSSKVRVSFGGGWFGSAIPLLLRNTVKIKSKQEDEISP